MKKLKPIAFGPPFVLCVAAVVLNFTSPATFDAAIGGAYRWVCETFGWLVSLLSLGMVVLCAAIYACPFGRTVLGGPDAKKLLTRWQMFAVVLTTNIGAGILFWCTFEPLSYLAQPPASLHAAPNSPEAVTFAISTVYLHWTFTPYAIPAIVGLMFAFAYYNMRKPFSLGAPLSPLMGRFGAGRAGQVIDAVCLYSLAAALAASLGGASLLLGAGIHHVLGIPGQPSNLLLAAIMAGIMVSAVLAAISGLTKGIRVAANINTYFLIGFLALILVLGPTRYILNLAVEGLGSFLGNYFQKVTFTGAASGDKWPHQWTQMYFSAYFAWAPIMGVFLGRIARGYTVRAFLVFNMLLPALFTGIWMAVFCGVVAHMEVVEHANLAAALSSGDPSAVLYPILERIPGGLVLIPLLLVTAFLSFVTTADGNTDAMSNISSTGISPEHPESSRVVKVAWGAVMGLLSWIMVAHGRIDGIRELSNLGGWPSLFLCLAVAICAIRVAANPAKFDVFHKSHKQTANADEVQP